MSDQEMLLVRWEEDLYTREVPSRCDDLIRSFSAHIIHNDFLTHPGRNCLNFPTIRTHGTPWENLSSSTTSFKFFRVDARPPPRRYLSI